MSRRATSPSFDLPAKDSVELLAPGGDLQNTLSLLPELVCSLEAASSELQGSAVLWHRKGNGQHTWHLVNASLILSTLISLKPLIFSRLRRVAACTEATVK
jgi:hypothetical protein